MQVKVIEIHNRIQRGSERGGKKSGHDREPHETDAHFQAGLQRVAEFDAYAYAENGEDHRHHHSRSVSD